MGKESDKFTNEFKTTFNDLVAYAGQLEAGYVELIQLLEQRKAVSDEMVGLAKDFANGLYGAPLDGPKSKAPNSRDRAERVAKDGYTKDPTWLRLSARFESLSRDVDREQNSFNQFATKAKALHAKAIKTLTAFEAYVRGKESSFWKSKKSVPASKAFIQKAKTDLARIRLPR